MSKRNRHDRKDARWVKEADSMHHFMPYLIPNRADNEAVLDETCEIENALIYLQEKNSKLGGDEYKYSLFHLILAGLSKVLYLRPKMNRFIQGHRLYERNQITFSFVIKKGSNDKHEEGIAIINLDELGVSPIENAYQKVKEKIEKIRQKNETDRTNGAVNKLVKLPRWLLKIVTGFINFMDYHGIMPKSLTEEDPYFTSIFVSNLGSIKMNANYHHLTNYGTNSCFVIINEKKKSPFYDEVGNVTMKDTIDVGFTIDERIADGVYFAKSIRLFKYLLKNPKLLELPLEETIDFE